MRKKMVLAVVALCLLILPVTTYATTENSVLYLTNSEKDKVYLTQLNINNLYQDLGPGEYFTLELVGAEFDEDAGGNLRIRSSSIEFEKISKTRIIGKTLTGVVGQEDLGISFYSKVLADEALVKIDGEDSHITSGTYTYAIDKDSDRSHKSQIKVDVAKSFYKMIDLEPVIIQEKYTGALRSSQIYDYDADGLIKLELPKGDYEFYNREYIHPITVFVEHANGEESRYQLDKDIELKLSSDRTTLLFKQYNQEILQASSKPYKIRIENLRIKAVNSSQEKDVYMRTRGSWLEDEKILIAKEVKEELIVETSKIGPNASKEAKVTFRVQETSPGTLLRDGELALGLRDGQKINFKGDFKLKVKDGKETYTYDKKTLKVEQDGDLFIIKDYKRKQPYNLIEIEGEFLAEIPEKLERDLRFLVSAPEIKEVFYSTLLQAEKVEEPEEGAKAKVVFKIGSQSYRLGSDLLTIDASPYMSSSSRIMVPFRYLTDALGVDPASLKWDGQAKIISFGEESPTTINVKTKEMNTNSVINTLSEVEVIKGRTFVPVGEIAKIFGIQVKWDGDNQTATFN